MSDRVRKLIEEHRERLYRALKEHDMQLYRDTLASSEAVCITHQCDSRLAADIESACVLSVCHAIGLTVTPNV